MRSPRTLIIIACLALAAALSVVIYVGSRSGHPSDDSDRVRRALESAAAYLAGNELRGNEVFMATQGAIKLGPAFRTWAETLTVPDLSETELRRDPLFKLKSGLGLEGGLWKLRWLAEAPAPSLPPPELPGDQPLSITMTDADVSAIFPLLAYAVACPRLAVSERAAWLEGLRTPGHSYMFVYQAVALMLGRNQGCLDEDTTEPLRVNLATALQVEQALDRSGMHDLSISRLAALCYAQVSDWLRTEWLDELIRTQQPSGSWGVLNPGVNERIEAREQSTAVQAFYVLATIWQQRFTAAAPPQPPVRR